MKNSFPPFTPKRILLIGDFMLDSYVYGAATRISPEAPVPLIKVEEEKHLPGGAGNVFVNLKALTMEVIAIGRRGPDLSGALLEELLSQSLYVEKDFHTTMKKRVIAGQQQLLRIDHEKFKPLSVELEKEVRKRIKKEIQDIDLIAISDYGKGFLSKTLLSFILNLGKKHHIPVIVDPKGSDFSKYKKSSLIKPNLSEAIAAARLPEEVSLDVVAKKLLKITQAETIMITRSKEGISLFHRDGRREDFPAEVREVVDVTGAGDTVLAVLAAFLANKISLDKSTYFANVAGGMAIEKVGCASISLEQLKQKYTLAHAF